MKELEHALREVAQEIEAEWRDGERSADLDLFDLVGIMRRVADKVKAEKESETMDKNNGTRVHRTRRLTNRIVIEGQEWLFKREKYRSYDRLGCSTQSLIYATRSSDGRSVTGSTTQDRLVSVIAERIRDGIY